MTSPPNAAAPIVGSAPAIEALRAQIRHLASFDAPGNPNAPTILLQGETGSGKGLVARVLHESGGRARGPFVDVNCAAIPETMLEAELFGFEGGAFTDAKRAKPGLFEAAAGGSLFLDEIDSLPLALQGKLLRAIEDKTVRRLGAVSGQRIDVKLIVATQRDLRELVAAGGFRPDLYHRLAVLVLEIPPLRTRADDVVLLGEHFLARHAASHGLEPKRLAAGARGWLARYAWPGNVRELSHLMERVTLLAPGAEIDEATLERLRLPGAVAARAPDTVPGDDEEAARIRAALARSGGNVVGAARLLGLGRNALRNRMRRYGIERPSLEELARGEPPGPVERRRDPAEPDEAAEAPAWEQRTVAVLALEMVLPDDLVEPWTASRRWEQRIEECTAGFGGIFIARSPARLSVAFGIPRALEQLPHRAVQAALAIRRRLGEEALRPEVRMAVHLGTLRFDARAPEPHERVLPLGDTLALAERLLGHADAGEILVSAPVARRVEAVCELHARELRVGAADAVRAWAVLGQRARTDALDATQPTRFIGRERELGVLRESFAAAADGHGLVVFVVGEAGIGKSRLLAEFRQHLEGRPHVWIEGRCASYGTTTAFLPIVDALRRHFGIDDRDDEVRAGAKIADAVAPLGPELAWTVPFLRQALALPAGEAVAALDSASRRSETFRALKAMLRALAERAPLVLLVEDLHWIDRESEEFLAFIADAIPTMRCLLVCSHRAGYQHPFGDHSYHTRVALRALSDAEVADLSGALLGAGSLPAEAQALIASKADGNPFFVEEMTRSLLEDGTLRRENGHVLLTRDTGTLVVPETIQDVLIARLDRLADEARRAIQVAAVIGREFAVRLLERIADAGEGVRTQVDELRALELIYEKETHPELAYMFKHALTHDVAYASVLAERRRELHRTIGLAIEELYADRLAEFYETLAHHFGRAEDWERALSYHERAAERAAESFSNRAVIAHCREGLAIAARLGPRVSASRRCALRERLGTALFYVSDFVASAAESGHAVEEETEPIRRAANLAHMANSLLWSHAYEAVARATERLHQLARTAGLPLAEALALTVDGYARVICTGDMAGAEKVLGEALALGEAAGDEITVATLRVYQAQMAEWTGDYRRSLALSAEAIAAGRRLRVAHLVVWPGWFLGKAACCLADYGSALARLTEAYEVCDRIGDRAWKTRLLNTLGWCFAEIGAHARAREYNQRAHAMAHAIGDPEIVSNSQINLALNHLALGDVDGATGHIEPIRAALAQPGDPWMRWRYTLHAADAVGRIALARREPEETLACADEQLTGARRHRVPKVEARALVARGEALLMLERPEEAAVALADGVRIADAIGYPRAAWQALGGLAEAARRAGQTADAEAHAARRRSLLTRAMTSLEPELRQSLRASVGE
jgi:transcriptional regulator with AAA-type ATPase domain/tetratricopeptide (TPR) repeat protein